LQLKYLCLAKSLFFPGREKGDRDRGEKRNMQRHRVGEGQPSKTILKRVLTRMIKCSVSRKGGCVVKRGYWKERERERESVYV
jgi:hypothetical protein